MTQKTDRSPSPPWCEVCDKPKPDPALDPSLTCCCPEEDKAARREAAVLLYRMASAHRKVGPMALHGDLSMSKKLEETFVEAVEEAEQLLEQLREALALRTALDALLPGWFYVDASDYLPQDLWNSFVSDSDEEWLAWLTQNGVSRDVAERLLKDQAPR